MISTKEHVLLTLRENFVPGVVFTLQEIYDLVLVQNRIDEIYNEVVDERSTVRAAIQRLEADQLLRMFCRDSMDLEGTYCLIETKGYVDPNQNIFDLLCVFYLCLFHDTNVSIKKFLCKFIYKKVWGISPPYSFRIRTLLAVCYEHDCDTPHNLPCSPK